MHGIQASVKGTSPFSRIWLLAQSQTSADLGLPSHPKSLGWTLCI